MISMPFSICPAIPAAASTRVPSPSRMRSGLVVLCYCLLLVSASPVRPQNAAPNEWTWMSGSSTVPWTNNLSGSQPGIYGTLGLPAAGNTPGGREAAASWTDQKGNLWLFGGCSNGSGYGNLNDLWQFNPSTKEWAWMGGSNTLVPSCPDCGQTGVYGTLGVPAAGNMPGSRESTSTWIDSSGNLWLFGGYGNATIDYVGGDLNELWEFNPSTNLWAWMGGSSTLPNPNISEGWPGVYGTMGVSAAGNIPGGREGAASWTDSSGNFWLFGGYGYDANGNFGELNDLWEFNPSSNEWTWVGGSSMIGSNCNPNKNDCGWPGVYGTLGVPALANTPGSRVFAATWTDSGGNFWFFGGIGYDANGTWGVLNDLWEFNPSTNEWAWAGGSSAIGVMSDGTDGQSGVYGTLGSPASGNTPGTRTGAESWSDSGGNLWLFGGIGYDANGMYGLLNDFWVFNRSINQWTWMGGSSTMSGLAAGEGQPGLYGTLGTPALGNIPGSRGYGSTWIDPSGNFWLFGGSGFDSGVDQGSLNDLWEIQPSVTTLPQSFSLGASPASLSLFQGSGSGTSAITVTGLNGFTGSVSLTASPLPVGVTASFTPNPTTGASVLTLTASSTAPTFSSFPVTIIGTAGRLTTTTTLLLTVSPAPPPSFTLSASPASLTVIQGASGTSTLDVTPQNGITGNVTLAASGLPSGVTAAFSPNPTTGLSVLTLTVSSTAIAGTYNATITGIDGTITASTTVVLTVIPPPSFTLSASPASLTVIQGASGTSTMTVTGQNGFAGSVTLAASGLPSGVTAGFATNPTSGTSVITLTASSSATIGTATVTITGTSGTLIASTTVVLTVNPAPSFTLSASPASLTLVQGASGTSTVAVTGQNGFTGSVNVAASGLPTGVTASFIPNPATGASALTLSANSSVFAGTYNVLVTGTSGSLTATTNVVLTIIAPGFTSSSTNFGSVNIGTASPTQTLTYTFGAAITLGSTAVLTQGATGLDFTDAGSDTCAANTAYYVGQSCTVNVTFTPRFAGTRYGAVVLNNINGNVLATGYLQGTGLGPQINFLPNTQSMVPATGLASPSGVAVDGSGNVYIADSYNGQVLKETLSSGGYTQSVVGGGFTAPTGVAVDGSGNVYIVDAYNNQVLKETPSGGNYTASVVAPNGTSLLAPNGVAVDGNGNVYIADSQNDRVLKETLLGGGYSESVIGTGLSDPLGVAVDGNSNVYIADTINNRVLMETLSEGIYTQSVIASNLNMPFGVTVDGTGNVYIADYANNRVLKETSSAAGYSESTISGLSRPVGTAVDGSGNVFVAEEYHNDVWKLDFADAPSLSFASTTFGSTSSDSPQTITVENVGNAPLTFPIPSAGNNPSIAGNFTLNSTGTSACPIVGSGSSTAGTLAAGASCQLPISFTPAAAGALSGSLALTDNNLNATAPGYTTQSIALSGTGTQATPTIAWTTPAAITYGTPLSATQLNATSPVAGSFTYLPAAGTVLGAGQQTLTATFTPTDTTDYTTATANVTLTVNQATPTITWATPAAITYGTALSATQLNAASTVAGSFTYLPAAGTVLGAGKQTLTATFTPNDTTDYTTATASVTLTVNQATPTITWATPAAITYGTALSGTQLNATSPIAGSFTYLPAAGTVLGAVQQTLTATFTPNDVTDYTTATASVALTVNKATPAITWATPAAITYGTALSGTQLNATSPVAGSITYLPAAGAVLGAGQQTLTATFTPNDTTDYTTATASVTLTVNQATPTITWATPAAITYGTALSGTQLNATSPVAGSITYLPAAGAVLGAGQQTLTATFTPNDTTDYTTATATVTLTVNKAALTITWATPAAISYGTALSGTQLNATSTAAGTFTYSPAAGTVLGVGNHTLTATFTPTNAGNYTTATATATVTLTVNKAAPTITWATPVAITYGTALSATQLDASSTVAGSFTYSPAAGTVLGAGTQTLTATFTPTNTTDYTTATDSVTLTVNKATPAITWATPKAITYGTALSATQLDASSTVAGSFTYSPAAGTVLAVGSQTLTVTFAPTNTTDYTTATDSVTLTVNPAPSFTLGASPASLTVAQGASGKSTLMVTGQNGFTGSVTLAASGLPSGVTAAFATNPTTGTSVLTLTASSTATTGTATVTIKGTSGSLTASTTVALTISCTPTTIVPYISVNGGSTWTEESSATVSSTSTVVDLGPQPASGGTWSWTGPNGYTSISRQISSIPLTVGADLYVATYTNSSGCKSTETFTITVK
jgi:N-acetylneuraminic acid mutarotase